MTGCNCDRLVHPAPLNIAAGLERIPRQIGTFAEFRRALLASVPAGGPLSRWRPGNEKDLGSMLLEAWAYICDVQSFHDETIAHEIYLRTARLRPSVRRLVELLGYVPKPATAASVDLAVLADGRKPISLPAGTGFRSGAFGSEPPQVFELAGKTNVHPLVSKWQIEAPRPSNIGSTNPSFLLLENSSADLAEGDICLALDQDANARSALAEVESAADHEGADGDTYSKVVFTAPLRFTPATSIASVRLLKPGATTALRKDSDSRLSSIERVVSGQVQSGSSSLIQRVGGSGAELQLIEFPRRTVTTTSGGSSSITSRGSNGHITLDGLYRQIKPGNYIGMSLGADHRWFRVIENREVQLIVADPPSFLVGTDPVDPPPVRAPFTLLVLDATVDSLSRSPNRASNWASNGSIANRLIVHYGFEAAGVATAEAATRITGATQMQLENPVEEPADGTAPSRFLFQGKDEDGAIASAELDFDSRRLTLDPESTIEDSLLLPVNTFGNVVSATRGESVPSESLGTGDASVANQSFTLKKQPLTYVSAPSSGNESGVASTLLVRVNGVLWTEVPYLFGQEPDAQVYTVRQDDEGSSTIRFGDGITGSRLATGATVVAAYRFGAGESAPPSGSITQMIKAIKGVSGIKNPVAAYGGSDAEDAENIREYAPDSALTLGRAVSTADMQAIAAGVPGVRSVRAEWNWHEKRQRPVAHIWYIGDSAIQETVAKTLRAVCDPSTPIVAERATPIPLHLAIDIDIDEKYVSADVVAAVQTVLIGEKDGYLLPENLGIGAPLFRSELFENVLAPAGALAVHGLEFKRQDPRSLFAFRPYRAMLMRIQTLLTARSFAPITAINRPAFTLNIGNRTSPTILTLDLANRGGLREFENFVLTPSPGHYFDITAGSLKLNGEEVDSA